jgi:hypothetical protein
MSTIIKIRRRLDAALLIRDHVLWLMEAEGGWCTHSGIRNRSWGRNGFSALLNTPFNPRPSDYGVPSDYLSALWAQRRDPPMTHHLDLWYVRKKVLFICWRDGATELVSFRRGPWEQALLQLIPGHLDTAVGTRVRQTTLSGGIT